MADLAGALGALNDLNTADSSVTLEGPAAASVEVRYRDVSQLDGGAGRGRAAFRVTVRLDEASGEYELQMTDSGAAAQLDSGGLSGSYSSTTMLSGSVRTVSFASGSHAGEPGYGQNFDSKPWVDAVKVRVEAFGWRERKGFWNKLFS